MPRGDLGGDVVALLFSLLPSLLWWVFARQLHSRALARRDVAFALVRLAVAAAAPAGLLTLGMPRPSAAWFVPSSPEVRGFRAEGLLLCRLGCRRGLGS